MLGGGEWEGVMREGEGGGERGDGERERRGEGGRGKGIDCGLQGAAWV